MGTLDSYDTPLIVVAIVFKLDTMQQMKKSLTHFIFTDVIF